ncbi:MAG: HAD-IG family 5'-nucleotidase [Bacteriovorax sp.]|nr:HAD-IG family 5'-nucleotidase [Bacteriovorax sp.]
MGIFINRTLNMKKIKAIGFDMDYTIVRYNTEAFERFTHQATLKKLVSEKKYPEEILSLEFDFQRVIQGLVIDKKKGNLLKVSRFGKVKSSYHGLTPIDFKEQQKMYGNGVIDLSDIHIQSLDTNFSVSNGVLYSQLIEMKKKGANFPDFETLADDVKEALDICHSDGTLKNHVRNNISEFIIQDPEVVTLLERYKRYGKKLLVITNSDFNYTKLLLDYTINPFLKEHKDWSELFEITITLSSKPRFFTTKTAFLKIDPATGLMTNAEGKITKGIYQGGFAGKLQKDLGLEGDEILYLGDHIYGDVVSIKKTFNWRTALVLDPLKEEIESIKSSAFIQSEIDKQMAIKESLEHMLNDIDIRKTELHEDVSKEELNGLFNDIDKVNSIISELLDQHKKFFNPYWGEMMRAGLEESRFADQVEKYACIYMTKVADLISYSPRTYFRPFRRTLPHEL